MPTWPGTLPQVMEATGYDEQFPKNSVSTQMDSGVTKSRKRFSAMPRPIAGNIECDLTQVATLETFYLTDTAAGSLAFDWVHPRTGSAASFKFKRNTPPRIIGRGGGNFIVRLELELQI